MRIYRTFFLRQFHALRGFFRAKISGKFFRDYIGKRSYRINLIDSILNKPVGESIVNDLESDTVKSFVEKAIFGIPVYAITTDHRIEYKSIMDELKIDHQLCIFHLYKMIGKEIFPKLRSKFISNTNKIHLSSVKPTNHP